ncbi:hypothetical protein SXCC_02607 [Gluconacetobacter sp. SXCC-1]|nr:hypothetical protein SXCC_02607 [Gluconacetobacter sp. SXCC-1]
MDGYDRTVVAAFSRIRDCPQAATDVNAVVPYTDTRSVWHYDRRDKLLWQSVFSFHESVKNKSV